VAAEPSAPYVRGDLAIDYAQRRVTLAGHRVNLTPTEYGLLAELSAHAGRVLSHGHLLELVWRQRGEGNVRPMRMTVSKLRRKLGDDASNPTYVFTEPGVGFVMPRGETAESKSTPANFTRAGSPSTGAEL
jgi:two-component system KDP operon response regulator KdpE